MKGDLSGTRPPLRQGNKQESGDQRRKEKMEYNATDLRYVRGDSNALLSLAPCSVIISEILVNASTKNPPPFFCLYFRAAGKICWKRGGLPLRSIMRQLPEGERRNNKIF